MIELKNFYKSYGSKKKASNFCIEDLSMSIPNGSVTGLLGVNGAGKSTVLKAITSFHFPDKGQVIIDGVDITQYPEKTMELTGYVPENPLLPKNMVVHDFLKYAGETHGLIGLSLNDSINNVIKECALEKFIDKKIKTLSKGQTQRVSFAQALIHNPKNLILDEPVTGLDPAQIIVMRNLIKKLSKSKAVLMSTHILQEVEPLCLEIYVMNNGKIAASGSEEDIVKTAKAKNLEEAFLTLSINPEN